MLKPEENALLTQTGPGTPLGALFRRYWLPALLSEELRRTCAAAPATTRPAWRQLDPSVPYERLSSDERTVPRDTPWQAVAAFAGEPVPTA